MNYKLTLALLTVTLASDAQGISSGTLKNMREQRDIPQQIPITEAEEAIAQSVIVKTNTANVLRLVQSSTRNVVTLTPKGMTIELKESNRADIFKVGLDKNGLCITHGLKGHEVVKSDKVIGQALGLLEQLNDIEPGTDISREEQKLISGKINDFADTYHKQEDKLPILSVAEILKLPGAELFYAPIVH